jgi:hypothetical protein
MNFKPKEKSLSHLIDEESGIEFLEKNVQERVKRFIREGWDTRATSVTFVVRGATRPGAGGSGDIEFPAKGLTRAAETKYADGNTVRYAQLYGFEIPYKEFLKSFSQYVGSDPNRLEQVKKFVTEAILTYLGNVQDKKVIFQPER